MAKKTETNGTTKVRRYRATEDGMEFLKPSGAWVTLTWADMHEDSVEFFRFYGAGQKFADAVYARGKDEEPATDEDVDAWIEAAKDGTLKARRAVRGLTLETVAMTLIIERAKVLGKKLPTTADERRKLVTAWLAVEANESKAKAAFEALKESATQKTDEEDEILAKL